jgi:hypothetical protein
MSLDHYHCAPGFQLPDGGWAHGHFTGSTLPMKFVDEHGAILDIYQQPTQLVDEYLLPMWEDWGPRLSVEAAIAVARDLLAASRDHAYGPTVVQVHADAFNPEANYHQDVLAWTAGMLDVAVELGLPIWSAEQWLTFVESRQAVDLSNVNWQAAERQLTVRLEASPPAQADLGLLLPLQHGDDQLSEIEIDGVGAAFRQRQVGGLIYGSIAVPAGNHQVVARYTPLRR